MIRDGILAILNKHTDLYLGGANRGGRWNCCICGTTFKPNGDVTYREHLADILAQELVKELKTP